MLVNIIAPQAPGKGGKSLRDVLSRLITHPYIALFTVVSGIIPITENVAWISSPAFPLWGFILLLLRFGAIVLLMIRPYWGSFIVGAFIIIDSITPIPSPTSMFFVGMVAVTYLSYARTAYGVWMAGLMALASISSMWLYPYSAMRAGGGYSFALIYLLCAGAGVLLNISLQRGVQERQTAILLRNAKVAQHLHDFTTNDLSNILMLIDREQQSSHDDEDPERDETLATIKNLAADALSQTRQVIVTLERRTERPKIESVAPTPIELSLFDLIDEQQDLLESLGFEGTALVTKHPLPVMNGPAGQVLLGFIRELFGNIAQHADPEHGYTLLITGNDDVLNIDCSDAPLTHAGDANDTGMGSGLKRYRRIVEALDGTWNVTKLEDLWSLSVQIPWTDSIIGGQSAPPLPASSPRRISNSKISNSDIDNER